MQRNNLCKIFTVDDVLAKLGRCPAKRTRKQLEKKVARAVNHRRLGLNRPKKIASDDERGGFFEENLYHPEELALVSSIIKAFLPTPQAQKAVPKPRCTIPDGSFANFFHNDSVGDTLFYLIRPYLSVWDLTKLIQSGVTSRNEKSGLFTIGDVLAPKDDTIVSRTDRILIGKEASKTILTHKGGSSKDCTRPQRVVDGIGDRWRWENLFHPDERAQVEELVEFCLQTLRNANTVANMPCAVERAEQTASKLFGSATFGGMDVTLRVALLIRGNENVLHLYRPPVCAAYPLLASSRWWYLRYFGDPFPGQSKSLIIRYCQPGSGFYWFKDFVENREVTLRFENMQEFDALITPFIADAAVAVGAARQAFRQLYDDHDDNDSDHGSLEDEVFGPFHI